MILYNLNKPDNNIIYLCFVQELEIQKSEYKKLFLEKSELEQKNASMKEHIEKELFSYNFSKPCNNLENYNLILLQQKGKTCLLGWVKKLKNIFFQFSYCGKVGETIKK